MHSTLSLGKCRNQEITTALIYATARETETARQTLIFVLCIQQCFCLLMLARRLMEDIKGQIMLKRTTYYNPVSTRYK